MVILNEVKNLIPIGSLYCLTLELPINCHLTKNQSFSHSLTLRNEILRSGFAGLRMTQATHLYSFLYSVSTIDIILFIFVSISSS